MLKPINNCLLSELDRFGGATEAEFLTWINRIVAGHIAKVHRSYLGTQLRNVKREESTVDMGLFISSRGSVVDNAIHSEELASLEDAIRLLPDDNRTVVTMKLDNCAFGEIASVMGRSVDSVQKLWSRSLVKLRRSLMRNQQKKATMN